MESEFSVTQGVAFHGDESAHVPVICTCILAALLTDHILSFDVHSYEALDRKFSWH